MQLSSLLTLSLATLALANPTPKKPTFSWGGNPAAPPAAGERALTYCREPNYQGQCVTMSLKTLGAGICFRLMDDWRNYRPKSLYLRPGSRCQFYNNADCVLTDGGAQEVVGEFGRGDMRQFGFRNGDLTHGDGFHEDWTGRLRSWKCWPL
jgi:hypothetical protein